MGFSPLILNACATETEPAQLLCTPRTHPRSPSLHQLPQFAPAEVPPAQVPLSWVPQNLRSCTTTAGATKPSPTEQPGLANQPSRTEEAESRACHYHCCALSHPFPNSLYKAMRSQLSTPGHISVLSSHSCRLGSAGSAWSPSSFLPATAELHPTDTPEPVSLQPQLPVKMWPHCRQTPAPLSPPASGELPQHPEPPLRLGRKHFPPPLLLSLPAWTR